MVEAFRLWKFVRGKGQSQLCHDWSSSVLRIGRKEPSRIFFPLSKRGNHCVFFMLRLSGSETGMAQLLLSFKDPKAAQLVTSSAQDCMDKKTDP